MCEKRFPTFSFGQRSTDPSIIRGSSVITRSKSRKRKIVLFSDNQAKQASRSVFDPKSAKKGRKERKETKQKKKHNK